MEYSSLIDIIYKCGIAGMLALFSGAIGLTLYALWKILRALQYLEFHASRLNSLTYTMPQQMIPPQANKASADGGFVPHSEFDAYIKEEADKVSVSSGISDEEAVNILLEKIRDQGVNKGNVSNV
jgi:hypothetical protein